MKKVLRTAISLILAFVMTLQLFPASILATEEESTSPTAGLSDEVQQTDVEALAYEEEAQPAQILFEEESLRGENVKQFRMDDGSYVAVQYDTPVHYMDENGQWQDIDNTLCLDGASAARAYTAVNGDGSVSFAASLRDEAVLTTSSGGHSVQLFLYGTSDEAVEEPLPLDEPLQPGITAEAEEAQTNAAESEIALPAENASPREAASEAEPETPPEANAPDAEYAPSISEAADSPEEPLATYHEATAEVLESSALLSTQQEASFLPATLSTSLLYENVYDGVDLKYDVYGYNIKESILVNQPLASYTFSFVLHTGDLSAVMQEDGSILLVDAEETPVYGIPAPYMLDAAGIYSDAVCYTLEALEEGSYLLRVEADADWIAEAQFPVAIDPTIFKLSSSTPLSWGYIFSGLPNNTYSGTNPMVGYTALDNGGEYQIITHVNTLPSLPAGSIVTNARINIRHASFSNDSSYNYMLVEAHKLTIDKSAGQTYDAWLQSMTWNSVHPSGAQNYNDNVEDFVKLTSSTEGTYVQLDITKAAREWYQNAAQNRTLLFKSDCTAGKKITSTFYTPGSNTYFAVTYRNDFGLEDYYTYRSQSAGRAGTGYISDHMQRLTLVNPIISSGSNVMPFSLSLVYNSALNRSYFGAASDSYTRDYRNMLLGAGWKFSAQQCVQSVRISGDDANTLYWVYTDGDGTQHYFYETSNGVYADEDGLGLKITLDAETGHTNFKMTDDYGNETYFRDGILTYTKDAYGNGIYYCYNGSTFDNASSTTWRPTNAVYNRLTAIYRLNKGGTSEKLVEFTYDSNNRITEIKDEAQRITRLYYNTSDSIDYLDYIVYPDGAKADYTYGSSGMSGAYDEEANYGIWYVYQTDGTVDEFYEYYLNGTAHVVGNVVSCWNGLNRSSYRDWGADHQKGTSDDLRLEVVFDNWGRTVCSYTTNNDSKKILGSAALSYTANSGTNRKNNRITSVGSSGMTAVNLLPDGSMEYDSAGNWTNLSTGSSSAAVRDTENGQIARNGTWGLKFWISGSAAATDTAALCHSAVYLTAGKDYTFSGYFKTGAEMTWGSAAELRIKFLDSSGEAVWNEIVATAKPGAQINGGWQRVSATFPVKTSGYYRPGFWLSGCTDLAFIDDVQLEESEAASSYNLVQNGSFESGSNGWSWGALASTETYSATPFGAKALRMTGSQNATNRASRTIPLHCSSDTTFLLSGWAKGYSAPNPAAELGSTSRYFGLSLRIDYSDGTNELHSVPFAWASNDWQCTVGTIVPKKSGTTIDKIVVYCAYDFNSGYALFDNISLRQ